MKKETFWLTCVAAVPILVFFSAYNPSLALLALIFLIIGIKGIKYDML